MANRKIDALRKHGHDRETSLTNLQQPHDEAEPFELIGPRTTEDECIIREELREVISELQRLTKHRLNSDRDRAIMYKVLLEQYSREEVAKEFGVDYQTVCYIISRAQKHLRSVFKHIPPI
jgi:RNA polymerase sigma factor (sigma-70 family)